MDSTPVCTAQGERDTQKEREREKGRHGGNANAKGDELPAILQIYTHSGMGTHTLHVVMQCKSDTP